MSAKQPKRWLESEGDELADSLRPMLETYPRSAPNDAERARIWQNMSAELSAATPAALEATTKLPTATAVAARPASWAAVAIKLGVGALFLAAAVLLRPTAMERPRMPSSKPAAEANAATSAQPIILAGDRTETSASTGTADVPLAPPSGTASTITPATGALAGVATRVETEPGTQQREDSGNPAGRASTRLDRSRDRRPNSAPPVARDEAAARQRALGRRDAGSAAGLSVGSLSDELQLLGRARRLVASDPARALELTAEHTQRFPDGLLEQEREALAIDALLRLDRKNLASARAKRFLNSHPGSAHAVRLSEMLEDP
jgi:hypothetical protein